MGNMQGMPEGGGDAELRTMLAGLAERVAGLEASCGGAAAQPRTVDFTDEKLATIATSIYRARRRRAKLFDRALLSEPAWDMLLDLFIGKISGRRISTTSLCRAAEVSDATGKRWIDILEDHQLLQRVTAPSEARAGTVEISAQGFERMRKYILAGVTRFEMPMPD